ncbi:MAG TPA: hypothetical protein VHE82_10005 [Gemmatimonadaceae bacterium]|nr:hypothetical protein [Gemmatimonadaceae bacterium]
MELVGGFGLHHQFLIHNHVEALLRKFVALVEHPHGDLTRNAMLTRDQLSL